ncbi:glutathione S-transferase N-terminal domain-containing protein [Phenylobacterium sp. J426]|uniref:glutathione S-transferase family protein n=1 Tax=Phenylobacterium sp. J426 TaxID=2898439 RepID=UPI002151D819|nr:glutathione S-transferase N-terminal domain-containing protein [Phenylobacterium sp. J426]MCR5872713.1 glutathione S-transferase N-terminal domain-containing protein [Phenylobacterium sp. J426]
MEELGLEYEYRLVDILAGDQFKPDFPKLNPNNKQPVIVDPDGPGGEPVLAESGAILWYLGEKHGGGFVPAEPRARAICHQWLMFQMPGVGPMFGQNAHFSFYAKDKHPYSIDRYANEAKRLLGCWTSGWRRVGSWGRGLHRRRHRHLSVCVAPDRAAARGAQPRPLGQGDRRPSGGPARHGRWALDLRKGDHRGRPLRSLEEQRSILSATGQYARS